MPHTQEVSPGVFVVHLPLLMKPSVVNVTLVHDSGDWALIDTGINSDDSIGTLQRAMAEVGCRARDVRQIIATHHHPDHFGASQALRELTGARVLIHRQEYEASLAYAPNRRSEVAIAFFLRHGIPLQRFAHVPSPGEFWAKLYRPTEPDAFIADGDSLAIGRFVLEVVATPGHTQGHCVLYLRERKLLIVGDHLLPKITPHVGVFPGGAENPLRDFLDSQRKCQAIDAEMILPAHGGVYSNHRQRAAQIIQHHDYRMQEMLDVVRRQPHTAYDVARVAFDFNSEAPLTVQFPATFETIAHLEFLRARGRVRREELDGRALYSAQ